MFSVKEKSSTNIPHSFLHFIPGVKKSLGSSTWDGTEIKQMFLLLELTFYFIKVGLFKWNLHTDTLIVVHQRLLKSKYFQHTI